MEKNQLGDFKHFVIIGGSSGSLRVVMQLLANLPANFAAPILIVLHRNGQHESVLTELLAARSSLPVKEVEEKEMLIAGTVYIAPQDYHVLLEPNGCFSLDYSEKVHYSRPSIDVTFIAAAIVYKERLIGILLSGANADGASGMQKIRIYGGTAIIQDPEEAEVNYMPMQALLSGPINFSFTTSQMIDYLKGLTYR